MAPGPITFPEPSASEPRLILPALSSAIAFELGSGIRSYFLATHPDVAAEKPGAGGIALQIKLFNGHLLFASAVGEGPIPGPSNWGWADAKFNTVKKMGDSSWTVKQQLAKSGKTPEAVGLPFPEYAVAGGGVPIWIKGNTAAPVGAIIVSGLPQQEDHQLIMNAVFGTMPHLVEPPSDPSYITYKQ